MFREVIIGNGAVRRDPCYSVTNTECLYIATKFNDEARAKLVLRWEELERHGVFSSMKWGENNGNTQKLAHNNVANI